MGSVNSNLRPDGELELGYGFIFSHIQLQVHGSSWEAGEFDLTGENFNWGESASDFVSSTGVKRYFMILTWSSLIF